MDRRPRLFASEYIDGVVLKLVVASQHVRLYAHSERVRKGNQGGI